MSLNPAAFLASLFLVASFFSAAHAQKGSPKAKPTPPAVNEQEPVRVFTEEVRLPVMAVDQYGHYDPTLEPEDVLVLENGVQQQVRSVRHIPANVILLLDTGGELSGLGGESKHTNLTRNVAAELLREMRPGTSVALMQFNNSVEMIQSWTTDRDAAMKVLKSKLSSGKRARFSEAVAAAAAELASRPEGSRHLVLISDGVDSPGGKVDRSEALKRLKAARATIHVISYTEFVRQKKRDQPASVSTGQRPISSDPISSTDPTLPPGTTRSPTYGVSIRFDPEMRRQRKAYESDVKKSQQVLTDIAEESGGRIVLPTTADEMIAQARVVAREVGAEYVVSYRPTDPLAEAREGEYRRIEVASRRVGLSLRSRRGYVVPTRQN